MDPVTHCNVDQRTRNAGIRCIWRAYNIYAAKCDCAGVSPWTPLGELSDPLAGFKGPLSGGQKDGKGKRREEKGKGKGNLILMRIWNRAADWLRPPYKKYHG